MNWGQLGVSVKTWPGATNGKAVFTLLPPQRDWVPVLLAAAVMMA